MRTPITYEYLYRVCRETQAEHGTLIEQWSEFGFKLCPACHKRAVEEVLRCE